MPRTFLITGGCGFLGVNIAAKCLRNGDAVHVFDNLYRAGSERNLAWLRTQGDVHYVHGDVRVANDIEQVVAQVRPEVVFHLAGQVAMTTSIADPQHDFETNVVGGFNVLEAVRKHVPAAVVVYSSTNKVYGDLQQIHCEETETRYVTSAYPRGFDELLPLEFHSPYGCSKGAVDQYMLDYARIFGLRTVVFRHSSIFGDRQFSTYDQGWIGWFISQALEAKRGTGKPFTISGTGKQVRDVLFSRDLVRCYLCAVAHVDAAGGQAFNIGGGVENSLSLLELFAFLEREIGVTLKFEKLPWRTSDQKVFIADNSKAERLLGWRPEIDWQTGLRLMIRWMESDEHAC